MSGRVVPAYAYIHICISVLMSFTRYITESLLVQPVQDCLQFVIMNDLYSVLHLSCLAQVSQLMLLSRFSQSKGNNHIILIIVR